MSGCVDAVLETVFGIINTLFSPLVSERASDIVNIPRRSAGRVGGEVGMKEHNDAAVDEKTDRATERLERALLEVVEEVDEQRAGERDVVVGLHRVGRRQARAGRRMWSMVSTSC